MRRRLFALLLTIPLVASGAVEVVSHVCDSMGRVAVADCCCSHAGDAARDGHHAPIQLQTQPCCTVELSGTDQLITTQGASSLQVDEATFAFVGLTNTGLTASRQVCDFGPYRERGPPNVHAPPIFVRNCSFLN